MLQTLIVYCIVAGAALYAAWRWMPTSARASVVSRIILLSKRAGVSETRAARWQLQASSRAGCGDCGPCKACKTEAAGVQQR